MHYILKEKKPVQVDVVTWARWDRTADRTVKKDKIGSVTISTVFLGVDHNSFGGTPHLFETMVFGLDEEIMNRYSTWEEAEKGHQEILNEVKVKLK